MIKRALPLLALAVSLASNAGPGIFPEMLLANVRRLFLPVLGS